MNRFTDECPAFIIVAEEPARLISRIRDAVPSEQVYAQVDIGSAAARYLPAGGGQRPCHLYHGLV